ncbi:MAG: ROK family transcriptional regulator [Geminicoccaceae bacterium]
MALRGANQDVGRPFNRRIVLETIRLDGPIARMEIASKIGLTVQTVSTIVRELERDGLLVSSRATPVGRGVPPARLTINPAGGHAIGIQITPREISGSLVNLGGEIVAHRRLEAVRLEPEQAFAAIGEIVGDLRSRDPATWLLGVGLVVPGPFGVESMSFTGSTTLAGWAGVDIGKHLQDVTGLPSFIETDTAAAALDEQFHGYGTELEDYYYLFFGYGLGGTMVRRGEVLRGHWGNAGEIGHLPVVPDGELCSCGNRGCLELYVSLEALQRRGGGEEEWVDDVAPVFARAVRSIENLFDPQTVILGGIAPPRLLARLAATTASLGNALGARSDRTVPRILVARGGPNSVLRGAATLAVNGVLAPNGGRAFSKMQPVRPEELQ